MEPKLATWAKVLAIIGIIIGLSGIFTGVESLFIETSLEKSKEVLDQVMKNPEVQQAIDQIPFLGNLLDGLLDFPPWYKNFIKITGLFNLLFSLLLTAASFQFFQKAPKALIRYRAALLSKMGLCVIHVVGGLMVSSTMGKANAINYIISGVIFFILWLVCKNKMSILEPVNEGTVSNEKA